MAAYPQPRIAVAEEHPRLEAGASITRMSVPESTNADQRSRNGRHDGAPHARGHGRDGQRSPVRPLETASFGHAP